MDSSLVKTKIVIAKILGSGRGEEKGGIKVGNKKRGEKPFFTSCNNWECRIA